MDAFLSFVRDVVAPILLVTSPVTSYADQILSMHRTKSSAGFSLDVPLIMLVASLLRIFYYPGAHYDASLLVQSVVMIGVQSVLLHFALEYRPAHAVKAGESTLPFAGIKDGEGPRRPYDFWQWGSPRPYWQFLVYLFVALVACELVFTPFGGLYTCYSTLIGYIGLAIEATLPIPQIITNRRQRSCKGFRLSVAICWIAGDFMKVIWFFTASTQIPWAFKIGGMFQASCDCFLGLQYYIYRETEQVPGHAGHSYAMHEQGKPEGARSPTGTTPIPMLGKEEHVN